MLKSTLAVSAGTSASRVFGLIRDVVIAHGFGAGSGADAFFVAFRIPNFLRRLFAEGAFSQAFVPVLAEFKAGHAESETREFVSAVAGALSCVLVCMTVIGVVGANFFVWMFAPGFAQDEVQGPLTGEMLQITFPYLLFISLTALAAGVLNTFGRFAIPAVTPVLLNASLIVCALWLAPNLDEPVMGLAWGVLAGGVAQLILQLPFLSALGMLSWPVLRRGHKGVRRVFRLMVPGLIGASVTQINLLVDTIIASFLIAGSVSWLYYSDRLVEFPLGVFGIALATVILPNLSGQYVEGRQALFSSTMDWALRLVVVIGLPACAGLALLAEQTLTTVFHYGAFDARGVEMAGSSLVAYSLGLVGFIGVKVLSPGYFARQDTKTPVRIAAIAMVANIVLNLALVGPLAHVGLALATSLAAFLNSGLLLAGLMRGKVYTPAAGWGRFALRVLAALLVMMLVLLYLRGSSSEWIELPAFARALRLLGTVILGVGVYATMLWLVGIKPLALVRPPLR